MGEDFLCVADFLNTDFAIFLGKLGLGEGGNFDDFFVQAVFFSKKKSSDDFPGQANGENVSWIGSCNGFSHKDSPMLDCRIGGFLNNPIVYQGVIISPTQTIHEISAEIPQNHHTC